MSSLPKPDQVKARRARLHAELLTYALPGIAGAVVGLRIFHRLTDLQFQRLVNVAFDHLRGRAGAQIVRAAEQGGSNGVVLPAQAASAEETDGRWAAGPIPVKAQTAASHLAPRFDINALTAESDFTVFMRKEVPEDLRRAALRRLWVLMKLPMSCDELCYEPEPPAQRFACEELPVAGRSARSVHRARSTVR